MRKLALSIMLALSVGVAATASSQSPPPASAPDPAWKAPEVIAFMGLKKGDKVADVVAGRLTASLAQAVGPTGKVYAIATAEVVKAHPEALAFMKTLAQQSPNVVVSDDPRVRAAAVGISTQCSFDRTTMIFTTSSWVRPMCPPSTRRSSPH